MHGQPLDTLAARWAEAPHPTACAALADGLRKRGDLRGAAVLVRKGTDRFPDHVPLWLTAARVAIDAGEAAGLEQALARALALDPGHPLTREMAGAHAPKLLERPEEPEGLMYAEPHEVLPAEGGEAPSEAPALVTESLAALYHRQGHLAQALAAYAELAARDPGNATVAARHEVVLQELAASRPLPFDARESGGRPTGPWLADLASRAPARTPSAELDAFYEPAPTPGEAVSDPGAFQRWLEELDK